MKSQQKYFPRKRCHNCLGVQVETNVACSERGKEPNVDGV